MDRVFKRGVVVSYRLSVLRQERCTRKFARFAGWAKRQIPALRAVSVQRSGRWGTTHHPTPDKVETTNGMVEVAGRGAGKALIVEERPCTHNPP